MTLSKKQVQTLQKKMLHKRFFVIFSEPTEKKGNRQKIFPQHIEYQLKLERAGILFAAGPFVNAKGKPQGPGMIIIRAKTMAQAKKIASDDPFHKQGYRSFRIQPWMINEGGFNLNIKFSDGTFLID